MNAMQSLIQFSLIQPLNGLRQELITEFLFGISQKLKLTLSQSKKYQLKALRKLKNQNNRNSRNACQFAGTRSEAKFLQDLMMM